MNRSFAGRAALWIAVYLFIVLAPLFALLLGDHPPGRDFWTEFADALGYAGLSIMGLQFGLTARFRFITQPWGEDVIYYFHRQLTWVALALVVAHPALLIWVRPARIAALNVFAAGWRVKYANFSIYALVALMALSYGRKRIRLSYEAWHATHIMLALLAVGFGLLHATAFGFYLHSPLKSGLWVALVIVWVGVFFYTRLVRPYFLLRRPYRIDEVRRERGDSVTLALQPDGHKGFRFSPGQFAWLSTITPLQITGHPFSLASSAARTDGRIELTIRDLGDFTSTLGSTRIGRRVWLDGPYGAFTMSDAGDPPVLIAGGIGVTPMMSMLRTMADRDDRRPVLLIYANRTFEDVTFREELAELERRLNLKVVHVLEEPPQAWTGERGRLTIETLKRCVPAPFDRRDYFICGPEPMMDAAEAALASLGVPMAKYHSERYSFA
jgi:predicted ferric reductase